MTSKQQISCTGHPYVLADWPGAKDTPVAENQAALSQLHCGDHRRVLVQHSHGPARISLRARDAVLKLELILLGRH